MEGVLSTFCGRQVAGDRALIMAIVNRTPDSFYDRGATFTDEAAKAAARRVIDEGADVVDVGGVKAGPGGPVDIDEEIARVVPFIEWLRDAYPGQLISVDTWRSEVAKQACAAGADLINDTWGGHDPALADVAAEFGAGLVCSHTGGATPRTRPVRVNYGISERGVVDDVIAEVTAAAEVTMPQKKRIAPTANKSHVPRFKPLPHSSSNIRPITKASTAGIAILRERRGLGTLSTAIHSANRQISAEPMPWPSRMANPIERSAPPNSRAKSFLSASFPCRNLPMSQVWMRVWSSNAS